MADIRVDESGAVGQLAPAEHLHGGLADDELRHEAHAALLGIEAATFSLTQHRHLMSPNEIAQLSTALAAEVQRLHGLVDRSLRGRLSSVAPFVLRTAIEPVVACVRATGLTVGLRVPQRLRVEGMPAHTAQVIRALLENVTRHAADAPVTIDAEVETDHVTLRVSDLGPGIAATIRQAIFDRGVTGDGSDGSGLGLYIARRLMDEQGGSIWIDPDPDAGTTVFLRLRRPAVTERLYAVV